MKNIYDVFLNIEDNLFDSYACLFDDLLFQDHLWTNGTPVDIFIDDVAKMCLGIFAYEKGN